MATIDCYHGTSLARAKLVLSNGFKKSTRPRMWLGKGVYFFQDAPQLCRRWAEQVAARRGLGAPVDERTAAVLHVQLDTTDLLDLADETHWEQLHELYESRREAFGGLEQNGIEILCRPMTPNEEKLDFDHPVDHLLIDIFVAATRALYRAAGAKAPSAVRAVFIEGKPIHPTSWLFDQSSIVINVVDTSSLRALRLLPL